MNLKSLCGALSIRLSTCPFCYEGALCGDCGLHSVTLVVVFGCKYVTLSGIFGSSVTSVS